MIPTGGLLRADARIKVTWRPRSFSTPPDVSEFGFSKNVENYAFAVGVHYMYSHFGCIHKSLRVIPAMEAKVSDYVWSLEEIARLAD